MTYIADFKIGDKIYKKIGETEDKTILYEIKDIWEEKAGNWHDGYERMLYVTFVGECDVKPYLLAIHIYGSGIYIYGILCNK